jgi:hypothetical protein
LNKDAIVANSSGKTFGRIPLNEEQREKGTRMRHLLMRFTLAATAVTIISPVQAQIASPAAAPPPWSPTAYSGSTYQPYLFPAPTPRDAYRDGLINRWELERLEGPLPQALQGPPVDGNRGGDGGGGGGGFSG